MYLILSFALYRWVEEQLVHLVADCILSLVVNPHTFGWCDNFVTFILYFHNYAIIQFLFVASAINASVNNDFVVGCKVSVLLSSPLKSGKCVMMFVTLSNVSLLDDESVCAHLLAKHNERLQTGQPQPHTPSQSAMELLPQHLARILSQQWRQIRHARHHYS